MTGHAPDQHPFAMDDGVYLVGALSPEERAGYESHLRVCASCARSVAELAGLPGLLGRVPTEVAAALDEPVTGEPSPPSLLTDVLDRVRRQERGRRRRRLWAVAASAAACVLVAAVAVGVLRTDDPAEPPAAYTSVELAAVTSSPLAVTAQLTPVAWGTRITLLCSYAAGDERAQYADGPTYALVLRGADGMAQQVATWKAVPGRAVSVQAATSMSPADIAEIQVEAADGRALLRAVN